MERVTRADVAHLVFSKSPASVEQQGCVVAAYDNEGNLHLADDKDKAPDAPVLKFNPHEASVFVGWVRAGGLG